MNTAPSTRPGWLAKALPAAAALAAAPIHIALLDVVARTTYGQWTFWIVLAVPAAATLWCKPNARATWYRWPAIFYLSTVTIPPHHAVVLLAGHTWAIWDAWKPEPS